MWAKGPREGATRIVAARWPTFSGRFRVASSREPLFGSFPVCRFPLLTDGAWSLALALALAPEKARPGCGMWFLGHRIA